MTGYLRSYNPPYPSLRENINTYQAQLWRSFARGQSLTHKKWWQCGLENSPVQHKAEWSWWTLRCFLGRLSVPPNLHWKEILIYLTTPGLDVHCLTESGSGSWWPHVRRAALLHCNTCLYHLGLRRVECSLIGLGLSLKMECPPQKKPFPACPGGSTSLPPRIARLSEPTLCLHRNVSIGYYSCYSGKMSDRKQLKERGTYCSRRGAYSSRRYSPCNGKGKRQETRRSHCISSQRVSRNASRPVMWPTSSSKAHLLKASITFPNIVPSRGPTVQTNTYGKHFTYKPQTPPSDLDTCQYHSFFWLRIQNLYTVNTILSWNALPTILCEHASYEPILF